MPNVFDLIGEHAPPIERITIEKHGPNWELRMFAAGETESIPASAPADDPDRLRRLLDIPRRFLLTQEVFHAEKTHRR